MFFNKYPYTDFHELNLDWILARVFELSNTMKGFVQTQTIKYADPLLWSITTQYAQNTLVQDDAGNTYLSKQAVPTGVLLENGDYWLKVADFSAIAGKLESQIAIENDGSSSTTTIDRTVGTLVWLKDALYEVVRAMNVGDAYVIDSNNPNVVHVTIEELIAREVAARIDADAVLQQEINSLDTWRVTAASQIADLQNNVPYLASYWTQVWLDSVNGSDDNDGLVVDRPIKTVQALSDKYIHRERKDGGLLLSFRVNVIDGDNIDISYFQGVSGTQVHFYNETGRALTLVCGRQNGLRMYNSYLHFVGYANARITFDLKGDYTFGGDNTAYWFEYTDIVNTGEAITNCFYYALGANFTFINSTIAKNNIQYRFRLCNIWIQDSTIYSIGQCVQCNVFVQGVNEINSINLAGCTFTAYGTLKIVIDFSMRNYAFGMYNTRFYISLDATLVIGTSGVSTISNRPFIVGYGSTVSIPNGVRWTFDNISQKFSTFINGSSLILDYITPSDVFVFCDRVETISAPYDNIRASLYDSYAKPLYSNNQIPLSELDGQHYDRYFTGHFIGLNIQGNWRQCRIAPSASVSSRMQFVQILTQSSWALIQFNIYLDNAPDTGCTIHTSAIQVDTYVIGDDGTVSHNQTTGTMPNLTVYEIRLF